MTKITFRTKPFKPKPFYIVWEFKTAWLKELAECAERQGTNLPRKEEEKERNKRLARAENENKERRPNLGS